MSSSTPFLMPLRYKLPLMLSALLIVVVGAMCWFGYKQIEQVMLDATGSRLLGVTQHLNTLLAESARKMTTDLRQFGRDSLLRQFLERPDSATRERARALLIRARSGQTRALSLSNFDGTERIYVGPALNLLRGDSANGVSMDLTPVPATDTVAVGSLVSTDSGVVYRIRTPIVRNGADTIGWFSLYRGVGTSQSAGVLNQFIGSNAVLLLGNASGNLWTDITKTVSGPPSPPTMRTLTQYTDASGERQLGVATRIEGIPWAAWVQMQRSTALAPARGFLIGMFGVSFFVVLAGATVAWLVSRQATSPLAGLSHAVEDLANGKYDRRVTVTRRDEFGSLAASFNAMAGHIETSNAALLQNSAALKEANEELGESERRYRGLVDLLPDAVLVHRHDRIVFANPAALTLFAGKQLSDIVGNGVRDFVPEGLELVVSANGSAPKVGAGSQPLRPLAVRQFNGTMISADATAIPFTHDGQAATMLILRDVSERERLEQRFRQAQKMEAVGLLAGGVAHDFNNLLTVVTSYSAMLLTELPEGNAMREDIQEIASAADRAATLTRQLLAFSRQQVLEPRVLNLNAIVDDMEKMLRRVIPTNIAVETKLDRALGRIYADPGQLEQVLMNLCVNARDAMPNGGTLRIETSSITIDENASPLHSGAVPGSYVLLSVSDSGQGMTPAHQARIFDPFFTTKAQGKGTGLGLSTVYGIVQQSGGYVWVYSELGQGTVFRIYLPRVDAAADARREPATLAASVRGRETVLLVEDEIPVRTAARRILEAAGYAVLEVGSGPEAMTRSAQYTGHIDLLLTDMVMPDMSGVELSNKFRAERPGARTIYMSGYTEDTVLRQSVSESGTFFIQKPFTPQSLTQKIRAVLDLPG